MTSRVLEARIPEELADRLNRIAGEREVSPSSVVERALSAWLADEEERDRLTREALADADAGHAIAHRRVVAWAESLDTEEPLPAPE
jgi:predicted transcriptional regulator